MKTFKHDGSCCKYYLKPGYYRVIPPYRNERYDNIQIGDIVHIDGYEECDKKVRNPCPECPGAMTINGREGYCMSWDGDFGSKRHQYFKYLGENSEDL